MLAFLPYYAVERLGISLSLVGIAVSVHFIADSAIKGLAGYFLDRFSLRGIVHVGLLIALAGFALMANLHGGLLFIAASTLFGIGLSPVWLACLSSVDEENRASRMGALYTMWMIGLGSGPLVINFLMDYSYRLSFSLLALLLIFGWLLSTGLRSGNGRSRSEARINVQLRQLIGQMRSIGALIPGMMLQTFAAGMLLPVLPIFASRHLGLSHGEYSLVLMAGGGLTVLFLVPMGKLADMRGKKWFLVIGFSVFAVALFSLIFVESTASVLFLAAMMGISYAAVLPAWNALLASHIPQEHQGTGWGVVSMIEGVGIILGPATGGWIADRFNASLPIVFGAILLAALALVYMFFSASHFETEAAKVRQELSAALHNPRRVENGNVEL